MTRSSEFCSRNGLNVRLERMPFAQRNIFGEFHLEQIAKVLIALTTL